MPLNLAMGLMCTAEFLLWAVAGFLFWRKKMQRRFPAMSLYLALHIYSGPALLLLLYGQNRHWLHDICVYIYFYFFWTVYIASAVILFFVCIEVFRNALSALPGLMRFGVMILRWAIFISLITTITSTSFTQNSYLILYSFVSGLVHSVSILELCLLAFLCLFMNAISLPIRDRAFGMALGMGMLSSSDLIAASFLHSHTRYNEPFQFVCEAMVLLSLGIWIAYYAMPEPVRKPFVLPASSSIYRWNEIAMALGHTGTQVAFPQPAQNFFLTDIERVVDKVLSKNLKERASES